MQTNPTGSVTMPYPCGLCNNYDVLVAGDLCPRCAGAVPLMCSRCGHPRDHYGPCASCETGR